MKQGTYQKIFTWNVVLQRIIIFLLSANYDEKTSKDTVLTNFYKCHFLQKYGQIKNHSSF